MAACALVACALLGCAGAPPPAPPPPPPPPPAALAFVEEPGRWGAYHSGRHELLLPLPEGKAWRIDDHGAPELRATHAATGSHVAVVFRLEDEPMSRLKCESRAAEQRFAPKVALGVVEDSEGELVLGRETLDAHVLVGVEHAAVAPDGGAPGPLVGHVIAYASLLRRCLWFHFETRVPAGAEEVLSGRLALARGKILGGVRLDAFGEVRRERPTPVAPR
jgi:hypothetical protein